MTPTSFDEKSKKLLAKIHQAKQPPKTEVPSFSKEGRDLRTLAADLFSAVIFAGLLGYTLDFFLKTWPFVFTALSILGIIAGCLNIARRMKL